MPLRRLLAALAALALVSARPAAARQAPTHTLMPVPAEFAWADGALTLDSTFAVGYAGFRDGRLERAVGRAFERLRARTGLALRTAPAAGAERATLVLDVAGPGEAIQSPAEDESYRLEVTPAQARLSARTVVGALRGLETLLQLVTADARGWRVPAARIADRPRFPWRGLLLDAGRHFMPVDVVLRQLDAMAQVKLNVLHWHLTEDQGFRVESRRFPRLHGLGSDGRYYTQAEIRQVVAYARDRGIRVVPEFDMPAHTTAWFVGYPELAAGPGPYAIERRWGVFDPNFEPTREAVYAFLDRFVGEMVTLFPDRSWHVGGDESNGVQWRQNPRIRAFMRARGIPDEAALQAYFNRRLSRILARHGRRMVGWDEILHAGTPAGSVIQSWRGAHSLVEAARRGFGGILSSGYYLDHMKTAAEHYAVDPLPAASGLDADAAARVLGGEACMWAEYVTPETVDGRVWPRLAAIAERLWSPASVTDVADMYRRLAAQSVRLEEAGVRHLAGPPAMLRRLAQAADVPLLLDLARSVEPLGLGERVRRERVTQLVPLVRLEDAAVPDAPLRRDLARWTGAALGAGDAARAARDTLGALFTGWERDGARLRALAPGSPLLADAAIAGDARARLGALGREALAHLGTSGRDSAWQQQVRAALDTLAKPVDAAVLRLVGAPDVLRLVEGAGRP